MGRGPPLRQTAAYVAGRGYGGPHLPFWAQAVLLGCGLAAASFSAPVRLAP